MCDKLRKEFPPPKAKGRRRDNRRESGELLLCLGAFLLSFYYLSVVERDSDRGRRGQRGGGVDTEREVCSKRIPVSSQ